MFDTFVFRLPVWDLATFCGRIAEDVVSPKGALLLPKGADFSMMESLNRRNLATTLARQGVSRVAVQEKAEHSLDEILNIFRGGCRPSASDDKKLFENTLQFVTSYCKDVLFGSPGNIHVFPLLRIGRFLAESVAANPEILLCLVRERPRDYFLLSHSLSVGLLCAFLAHRLFPEQTGVIASAAVGGLLHDIGKQYVPDGILNKPGRLTEGEFALIRRHPEVGEALLKRAGVGDTVILKMVRHHHEKMNGSGYPDGLEGRAIPVAARISAVADAYDAITSERSYKKRLPGYKGISEIIASAGNHLDPLVVRTFVNAFGMYPPGTEVELSDGRCGVVAAPGERSILKPRVCIRTGSDGSHYLHPVLVDLATEKNLFIQRCISPAGQAEIC
jgi:putative nucleotidyltransferase with HDIG domain